MAGELKELVELMCLQEEDNVKKAENTLLLLSRKIQQVSAQEDISGIDLMPSMLKIMYMIKTEIYSCKSDQIKTLSFKILLAYPDELYMKLKEEYFIDVMEILNLYMHQDVTIEIRVEAINVLHKYLKLLPPEKRLRFVKDGVNVWFHKLIPNVMEFTSKSNFDMEICLEALEIVTNDLVIHVNYGDNLNWEGVLKNIYTPKKYPATLKKLLEKGSAFWHRLWIIFIRLLKKQITKSVSNIGSPINSILPVVETAFKMDTADRCLAFHCWNSLIDNFSTETDKNSINKRIKLLLIPIYANNAKAEEVVIAKVKTWWLLIYKFHSKVEKFPELLLIPFLHFCFGKPCVTANAFVPGLLSDATKEKCMETLVNMFGNHSSSSLPELSGPVITTSCLVESWEDLVHCLSVAIEVTAKCGKENVRELFQCAWNSFINIISDLSTEMRQDFFIRLLTNLLNIIQNCSDEELIVLNDLILTLFIGDEKINKFLRSTNENSCVVDKIITLLLNPSFESVYKSKDMTDAVTTLAPLAVFTVEHYLWNASNILQQESPAKYNYLVLWTAVAALACEKKHDCGPVLSEMLLWPFKQLDSFTKIEFSTTLWFKLYDLVCTDDAISNVNHEILTILKGSGSINSTNLAFLLNVSIMSLKKKMALEKEIKYEQELELCRYITCLFRSLDANLPVFITLMDILSEIFNKLLKYTDINICMDVLSIVTVLFSLTVPEFKKETNDAELLLKVEMLLKSIENILQMDAYASIKRTINAEFIQSAAELVKHQSLKTTVLAIMHLLLSSMADNNPTKSSIKKLLESLNEVKSSINHSDQSKITTPNRETDKELRKKKTSIVNTVVENGEEFAVIKSNWKFNPKNLTEKQKEKLKRQREDIPALYQDLSQSQEEFKLTTWKTDSQDTTMSSESNSKKILAAEINQELSSILQNMPNTDVVPKILKNILENNNRNQTPNNKKEAIIPLKERVFRNVRNLIEKSSVLNNDESDEGIVLNEDVLKTPTEMSIQPTNTVINSAPSNNNLGRPTRLRRQPKKFADTHILSLRKRRHSVGPNEFKNVDSCDDSNDSQTSEKESEQRDEINITTSLSSHQRSKSTDLYRMSLKKRRHSVADTLLQDANSSHCNDSQIMSKKSKRNNKKDFNGDTDQVNQNLSFTQMPEDTIISDIDQLKNRENVLNDNNKSDTTCLDISNVHNESDPDVDTTKVINRIDTKNDCEESADTVVKTIRKPPAGKKGKRKCDLEKVLAIDMVEGHPLLKQPHEINRVTRSKSPTPFGRKSVPEKLSCTKGDTHKTPKSDKKLKEKVKGVHKTCETQDIGGSTDTSNTLLIDSLDSKGSLEATGSQDIIESSQASTISGISVVSTKKLIRIPFVKVTQIDLPENFASNTEVNTPDKHTESFNPEFLQEIESSNKVDGLPISTQDEVTQSLTDSVLETIVKANECSSALSLTEEEQRKREFLNNTLEISPIKTLSPIRETKSPSPETSSDFVVVKFDSPVQSNGEPIEKCGSPEVFTEEQALEHVAEQNISPDQRNQSPPRKESGTTKTSARSLSLKKNKPQVRVGGRAAQMLGLCVPPSDRLQTIINNEKPVECTEPKKSSLQSMSARRNLRLFNSADETSENNNETDNNSDIENEHFLKLKRTLPALDSSPSVPILKRKLADIADDTTISPASKKKRVSFHDPPVSTMICVKKYIDPNTLRSPQNSVVKRQERQARPQLASNVKSKKRLDTSFKLDKALSKAVESFTDIDVASSNDTEMSSLEPTPQIELVKHSELNNVDPICIELVNCKHPIENIAEDLSSSAMWQLLVQEFAGKIETVGDLARMTELEVNRLCIKAPKIQVTRKVLTEYLMKINTNEASDTRTEISDKSASDSEVLENNKLQSDSGPNQDVDLQIECTTTSLETAQSENVSEIIETREIEMVTTSEKPHESPNEHLTVNQCNANEITPTLELALIENSLNKLESVDTEMQTDCISYENVDVQTEAPATSIASTQTNTVTVHRNVQTNETGEKSSADIVTSLLEKSDFCERLEEKLDLSSKQSIAETLPFNILKDILIHKVRDKNSAISIIDRVLNHTADSSNNRSDMALSILQDYIQEHFSSKDLIMFCSELLKKVHDNS